MAYKIYLSPSTQEHNVGIGDYGTEEKRMNQVADAVERTLKAHGIVVYRNRPEWSLAKVVVDSNAKRPDLHLAIHSNAGGGRGCEVYAYAPGGNGEKAAKAIYAELEPLTPTVDRGVKFNRKLYELRETTAPAVLVETAFHDNPQDAAWIMANVDAIGQAIARGVLKFFGIPHEDDLSFKEAVDVLKTCGIIDDPPYWLENAVAGGMVKGEYAADLIRKAAQKLKGGKQA